MTETATRTVTITIPMSPPAALSPNARRRGNIWAQREATETLRKAAFFACFEVHYGPHRGLVTIHEHVIWPKSKRVLPDTDSIPSYCKAALDGIVDAGIIAGDSAKYVVSVTATQEKGMDTTGQIIITIQEETND